MDITSILGNKETWESLFSGTGLDLLKLIIPTFLYVLGILIRKHLKSVLRKMLFSFIAGISLSIILTAILVSIGYSPLWFLVITAILIIITYSILHILQDHSAMREHPNPIDKDIPDTDFKVRLNKIAHLMAKKLRDIDIELNWEMEDFIPLEAEVEMQTRNGKIKKVLDLLSAIKKSEDNLFLVIGDPGAGKSVVLRKLCQDLYEETPKTGKLPIYLNLKEWKITKPWNMENYPPTVAQLHEFAKDKIINNNPHLAEFFDKYYMRMYETGRLYFILDSFDEIPAVLDEKDRSPLIKCLSQVMYDFLKGARTQEAQGVLSSRIFRKPTMEFDAGTLLEIRPFSEEKMIKVLRDKKLTHTLFAEKPDFVTVARNPLLASLVHKYIEKNGRKLPDNQVSVFESHIHHSLANRICQEKMQAANLSETEILNVTMDIATFIFNHYGLECPITEIIINVKHPQIEAVLDILKIASLARQNAATHIFSFIHRRFCEYFVVCKWIADDSLPDINTIPEDTKNRDALVLYCGVAKEEKARLIANFCWDNIKEVENLQNLRALHSFRFLCDAFTGRNECIIDFKQELASFIEKQILLTKQKNNDFISAKLAIEGLRLFPDFVYIDKDSKTETPFIQKNLWKIFIINNNWLNEIAFKSARCLDQIHKSLLLELSRFILNYNIQTAFKNRKTMLFSLDLSNALKEIRIQYQLLLLIPYLLVVWLIVAYFIAKESIIPFFVISLLGLTYRKLMLWLLTINSTKTKSELEHEDDSGFILIFNHFGLLGLIAFFFDKSYFLSRIMLVITFLLIFFLDKIHYLWLLHKYSKIGLGLEQKGVAGLIFNRLLFVIKPILYILSIPFLLLAIPFGIIYDIFSNTYKAYKFKDSKHLDFLKVVFFLLFGVGIIFFLFILGLETVSQKLDVEETTILLPIIFSAIFIQFMYGLYKNINTYLRNRKIYKYINKEKLNTRPYIYECFNKLSGYYQRKLITYLENNIKEVSGEWTNKDILNISNEDANIRLAKLEEKWLGLDR